VKNNIVLGRRDYKAKHENLLYGWKDGAAHKFYGKAGESTVWMHDKPHKSELHPTMKPVELIIHAIHNSTATNQLVLDLFGGSGSTLIAAEKTNRICYTMEIDPHYTDIIVTRWEQFTGKKAIKVDKNG
jgi:DNA modification methylase